MGQWEYLDVARSGSVLTITLNEPRRRNPLSLPMREELLTALRQAGDDDAVRAVVLTGAGTIFCAGGDIASMSDDRTTAVYRLHLLGEVIETLVALPKPVVAAVEGGAYGAGLSLMAACDHVVAAEDAMMRSSFGGLGLGTDGGLSWTLPRRVGQGRAREIVMFGDVVDAAEAQRIGLVERVVPGRHRAGRGPRPRRAAGTALPSGAGREQGDPGRARVAARRPRHRTAPAARADGGPGLRGGAGCVRRTPPAGVPRVSRPRDQGTGPSKFGARFSRCAATPSATSGSPKP